MEHGEASVHAVALCRRGGTAVGRIVGASKIARDITERKLTEARLSDSERQLRELIAAIPAAIYTTDAQGKITYFNQAAVELAGRTPAIGSDDWCVTWKLYHPDGRPLPHEQCPMAIALKEGRASATPKSLQNDRWDSGSHYSIPDSASRRHRQDHRGNQYAGGCQRAQTGRDPTARLAQ
jgi:PAS domain-containing protein